MPPIRLLLVQAVITGVVLGILFWRVDVPAALRSVPEIDVRWAAPGLALFTVSKAIHALRWRLFLRHRPEISTRQLIALFMVSNLANSLMPLRAGDLLRIEVPSRRYHIPRAELASSVVVVESLLDGVAFVLMLGAAVLLIDLPPMLRSPLLGLTVGILALFALAVAGARAGRSWHLRGPLGRRLAEALDGMGTLREATDVVGAVVLSCTAWLVEVTTYWMLAGAFGVELTFPDALVVTIAANMVVAIPLTPWNVGPYEVALTELLVLLGIGRVSASGFALGSHVLLIAWVGLTGLLAMWWLGLGFREVARPGTSRRERDSAEISH